MVFSETEWGLVGANRVKWEDHRQSIANKKKGGEGVIVILQSLRFSFFFIGMFFFLTCWYSPLKYLVALTTRRHGIASGGGRQGRSGLLV